MVSGKMLAGFCVAVALADAASASGIQRTLQDVNACAGISDSGQRLACYDGQAPKIRAALDVATEEDKFTLFGLDVFGSGSGSTGDATTPEEFGMRVPPKEDIVESGGVITEITAGLTEVAQNGMGHNVFVLDNGQVWRGKEGKDLKLPKNVAGLRVRVRQGSLGSYYLSREGQNRSVPVERLR